MSPTFAPDTWIGQYIAVSRAIRDVRESDEPLRPARIMKAQVAVEVMNRLLDVARFDVAAYDGRKR